MKNLTRHRARILESMKIRKDHPTAKMVFDTMKSETDAISFATVYNTLEYLVDNGLVKKLNIDAESCRYDGCVDNHAHLVCSKCGDVIDIPPVTIAEKIRFDKYKFVPEEITISIKGRCGYC